VRGCFCEDVLLKLSALGPKNMGRGIDLKEGAGRSPAPSFRLFFHASL
jgi:hypothetical protein